MTFYQFREEIKSDVMRHYLASNIYQMPFYVRSNFYLKLTWRAVKQLQPAM